MRGINISNTSEKPIYQQLFEQISSMILSGELQSDFNLPSIRAAAKELRISVITVKKAWEELERSGLIYTVAGKGCFISELDNSSLDQKRNDIIKAQFQKDIEFYINMNTSKNEFIEMADKYFPYE